ncbi:MAG: hypothetical protein ACKVVT_15745 [Dehalococcoidia bacterium]
MDCYDQLVQAAHEGATLDEAEQLAAQLLAGPGDRGSVARLAAAFAALEAETRDAHNRYREMTGAGVHGGEPDARAMPFFATATYIRSSGLYSPDELAELVQQGKVPAAWHEREARRLLAFLGVLRVLIRELDAGRLHHWTYGDEVIALGRRMAQLRVAEAGRA